MQAVILAAGLGKRMKDLTKDTPKPLLTLGEKTLLAHKLEHLPRAVDRIVIVVGYLGDKIRVALGDSSAGRPITYVEQKELKGTAHALQLCENVLEDRFLVLMGDDLYSREDLERLSDHSLALLAWPLPADEPDKKMGEILIDENGELLDIVEEQVACRGMLMNAAAYMLDKRFFKYPPVPKEAGSAELGLPQTMVEMAKAGEKIRIVSAGWWKNITSPEDMATFEKIA